MPQPKPDAIKTSDLAEQLGVECATVRSWVKDGCPHTKEGKNLRFDPAEVVSWRRGRGMDSHNRNAGDSPDIDAARLRKENALATKYELHIEKEKGKVVNAAEAARAYCNLVRVLRNRVQRIGVAVATRWPGPDAGKLQAMIDEEATEALREVSQGEDDDTTSKV